MARHNHGDGTMECLNLFLGKREFLYIVSSMWKWQRILFLKYKKKSEPHFPHLRRSYAPSRSNCTDFENYPQEYYFSAFETQFYSNIVQFHTFSLLIEQFMQFGSADWPFLPNAFECMKSVWPYIKISDWLILRNTVDIFISPRCGARECPTLDTYWNRKVGSL